MCGQFAQIDLDTSSSVDMAQANAKKVLAAGVYATPADFKKIFNEEVNGLYLLSLLLTGNQTKAEECFVAGIGESSSASAVRAQVRRISTESAALDSAFLILTGVNTSRHRGPGESRCW